MNQGLSPLEGLQTQGTSEVYITSEILEIDLNASCK